MRVDIARSRGARRAAVCVIALGTAAWAQIGWLRAGSLGGWFAGLLFLMLIACLMALTPRHRRRRCTRLVLLGHADARVYWRADPLWRWQNARRRVPSGSKRGLPHTAGVAREACKAQPATAGIDEVCIVEIVQWGPLCLWLTVCPRYPDRMAERHAGPTGRRKRPGEADASTRIRLCLPADAMPPERFHALCARCQAMRRGAGFLSPW